MTLTTVNRPCRTARPSILAGAAHLLGIWRQRQALKALDAAALKDIGLTPSQALAEARRPLWDAPETWHY